MISCICSLTCLFITELIKCKSEKKDKNVYLEELKKSTPDFGKFYNENFFLYELLSLSDLRWNVHSVFGIKNIRYWALWEK